MEVTSGRGEYKKTEFGLEINDYQEVAHYENVNSKYRHIYNLLFLKPGTYPSCPNMGIDLEQYIFDELTSTKLSEITEKIKEQVNTYVTSAESIIVNVYKYDEGLDPNGKRVAVVFTEDNVIYAEETKTYYAIVYDTESGLVSPFYDFVIE